MPLRSNRFLDSNQVCLWKDWAIYAILPEYCVQPSSGGERHCAPRAIDAYWILHVLWVHRGCDQLDGKIASLCVLMTIEEEYVKFNVQGEKCYFDLTNVDTTMDGFGWTPWFKLPPSLQNLCMEHSMDGSVFDPNCPSLPDVTTLSRTWRSWIPRSIPCRIWLATVYLGLPIHQHTIRDTHDDE